MQTANATAITLVTTSSGVWTINLPPIIINSAGIIGSKTYVIRDRDGYASLANPITIQAGLNEYTPPGQQTFSDGSTFIQITQPFGFATIVEQSPPDATTNGIYRVVSTSEYPEGFANNFTQLMTISTGTAIPNLQLVNTSPPDDETPYRLFVSAGSLLFNTIQSTDPQTNSTLLQVTSNQFQSTFSSFRNYFETSTILTNGISIGTISIPLVYVSDINAGSAFFQNTTNESGELSTSLIFADTTNSKFISSAYISTGIVSSLSSFVDSIYTVNVQPDTLSYVTATMKTSVTPEINVSSFILSKSLISITQSTMNITMKSLTANPLQVIPAYICTLNTNNICSIQATISSISTNELTVNTNILDGTLFRTNALSTSIISTGTLNIGSGNVSTFTTSSFFVSSPFVSSLTTSTLNANSLSTGSLVVGSFSPASISTNLLTASTFQAKQMTISSLTANQMFVSSFYDRNARISTISANVISTGYISASFAYFSVMSTALYSTVSTIANVANMEGLSANTISTAQLRVGFGDLSSTFTSTLTGGLMSFTSNVVISSIMADTISTARFNVSTVSTNIVDTFFLRTSTVQNALTNISSGYAQIRTIQANELRIPNSGAAVPTTNYLSAGSTLVGSLDASTIARTTGPISTGLMNVDTLSLRDIRPSMMVDNGVMIANGGPQTLWVSVGRGATIQTSLDGSNWTARTNAFTNGYAIAYSAQQNLWVALGNGGGAIQTSTDGINWTVRTSFCTTGNGIAYSAQQNLWVMVCQGGATIQTSPDGINWTSRTNGLSSGGGIAFNNSTTNPLWVAVGDGATIQTSSNGINWTAQTNGFTTGLGIAYSTQQSLWVAIGFSGGGVGSTTIQTSPNGINWTARTNGFTTGYGIAFNNSTTNPLWVAVGYSGGSTTIQTSPNGINWTAQTNSFTAGGLGIAYSARQNLWVAVGDSTTGGATIQTSPNGINWTLQTNSFTRGYGIAYGDSHIDITNPNFNLCTQPSTISLQNNAVNNILAYESTLAFNSTLYIQNNNNEVGINQINPTTALDVRSTVRGLGGATTISTINVTLLSAPIVNVDTLSTSARISTPRFVFSTLTSGNISAGFTFVSTLRVDELLYNRPDSNFLQISSGVYEGGRFAPVSISTIEVSSAVIFTQSVSTNVCSTVQYNMETPTPQLFVMTPGLTNNNNILTSLNGSNWFSNTNPYVGNANTGLFFGSVPGYNPIGQFYAFPAIKPASGFNCATLWSCDLSNYSTLNTTPATGNTFAYATNGNIQLIGGQGTVAISSLVYKQDNNPVGPWFGAVTGTGANINTIFSTEVRCFAYSPQLNIWVAVGNGTNQTAYSVDGISWTAVPSAAFSAGGRCVVWNGSYFIAMGYGGTQTTSMYKSTDGVNWGQCYSQFNGNGNSAGEWIAWNGQFFVICLRSTPGGSGGVVRISTIIATTLTTVNQYEIGILSNSISPISTLNTTNGFECGTNRVAWNGSNWFLSGSNQNSTIRVVSATSSDGLRWWFNGNGQPTGQTWGGITTGPSIFGQEVSTLTTRVATLSTLNNLKFSTNRMTADLFNPTSSISTTLISSVFGFFSTVGMPTQNTTSYQLNVAGQINASIAVFSNGEFVTSDSNIKSNITAANLTQCFQTMESMPLKKFTYKPEYSHGIQDQTQLGFIAQEVQSVFPNSIFPIPTDDGSQTILHVTFDQLFMTSYGATQHLMSIVEERQSTITSLYSSVETLQNQLSTLKGNNV